MTVPNAAGRIVRNELWFEERKYTRLPNDWVRDQKISFRALGILTYLMSHKKDWSMTLRELAAAARAGKESKREGLDATRTALNELEAGGYLKRSRVRDKGKLGGAIWQLADPFRPSVEVVDNSDAPAMALEGDEAPGGPETPGKPRSEPKSGKPTQVSPTQGQPAQVSPTQVSPTQGNPTTTEEHSPEDKYPEDQHEKTPTGHVTNVSTGVFPGSAQGSVERCSASRSGVHNPDPASGWCLNECGVRVADQIGAVA